MSELAETEKQRLIDRAQELMNEFYEHIKEVKQEHENEPNMDERLIF